MPGRFGPFGHASSFMLEAQSYSSCEMLSSLEQKALMSKQMASPFAELLDDLWAFLIDLACLLWDVFNGSLALLSGCTVPIKMKFKSRPLSETIFVVAVCAIMATLYFGMYLCSIRSPALARPRTLLAFHTCFAAAMTCYWRGIMTDPGYIPESWQQGELSVEQVGQWARERKRSGEVRFCSKEMKYKPDRAHYCSVMQRNILRMDHYCPWMSNCIGFFNYKFFLLFLFYTVASSIVACLVMLNSLWKQVYAPGTTVMILQSASVAALLASVLTPFLVFHAWLLSRNMTTIEFCEKLDAGDFRSPYDLGFSGNLCSIFGDNVLLWPLPIASTPGDGLTWKRASQRHRGGDLLIGRAGHGGA